jgi:transposase
MARRYGISRSLLLRWRQLFRPEPNDSVEPAGTIEIEFAGARMRIVGAVDAATLTAAVAALADGRPR